MQAKFELGQLVATLGVVSKMEESKEFALFVQRSFSRFTRADWGEMDESDKAQNDSALANRDDRLFAAYASEEHPDWRLWIITEWDRSATTLLFPNEY